MADKHITQTITPLPDVAGRFDADFIKTADKFLNALPKNAEELNTFIAQFNELLKFVNTASAAAIAAQNVMGAWDSSVEYKHPCTVFYNNRRYASLQDSLGKQPDTETDYWLQIDGSGSGLDADTVDGKHCNGFWSSIPYIGSAGVMEIGKYIDFHLSSDSINDYEPRLEAIDANNLVINGNKVWHSGNDGKGSGLDADLVQGVPKNLLGIGGDGYSWCDETSNRSLGTTYTNTYGKPILVSVNLSGSGGNSWRYMYFYVDDKIVFMNSVRKDGSRPLGVIAIVPPNSTYKVTLDGANGTLYWFELK